jgi:hypothetical protein
MQKMPLNHMLWCNLKWIAWLLNSTGTELFKTIQSPQIIPIDKYRCGEHKKMMRCDIMSSFLNQLNKVISAARNPGERNFAFLSSHSRVICARATVYI